MTVRYRLTPRAREGLRRIVSYVARRFGLAVAERVLGELEKAFERLARNPEIGHRREDLTRRDRVFFWHVGPSLIAYRPDPEGVEVLFVERGELDWERVLEEHLG